ncbi:MAG: type II toxin-antitoxin system HicA family toxin [Chloroflexota bacterium]
MSPKLPHLRADAILRAFKRARWYEHHQRGSHVYLRHPDKPGRQISIPMHRGRDVLPGTLASILDQAGISVEDFIELL